MLLKHGISYRLRMINISGLGPDLTVSLFQNGIPVNWRPLANDGADLSPSLQIMKPALDQTLSIGQTKDFKFNSSKPGNYLFAIRDFRDSTVLSKVLKVE